MDGSVDGHSWRVYVTRSDLSRANVISQGILRWYISPESDAALGSLQLKGQLTAVLQSDNEELKAVSWPKVCLERKCLD